MGQNRGIASAGGGALGWRAMWARPKSWRCGGDNCEEITSVYPRLLTPAGPARSVPKRGSKACG